MNDGSGGTERRLRIFINYRRADSAPYAGRLYDGLVARFGPENVFMDIVTIPLGVDFRDGQVKSKFGYAVIAVRTENNEPPNPLHFA